MGDYIEAIYPTSGGITDKRWSHKFVDRRFMTPEDQVDYVAELLEPIKDKCLGLLSGNHEWRLEDRYGIDLVKILADRLGAEAYGPMAFIELWLNKSEVPVLIFATHGHYGGRKVGGAINRIQDLAAYFDADIYLMGHVHRRAVHKEEYLTAREGKLVQGARIFGLTGTFLRSYVTGMETYVERRILAPSRIGTITIRVDHDGEIWGFE